MTPDRPDEPDHGIDVDAAFADIVAHYGDVPTAPSLPDAPGIPERLTDQPGQPPADQAGHSPDQAAGRPVNQPGDQPVNRPGDRPGDQPRDQPLGPGPGQPPGEPVVRGADAATPGEAQPSPEPAGDDPMHTPATWDDEGHFVPPPPPPLPSMEPRRRAAWLALLGAPLVMLVVTVAGVGLPGWVVAGLALAFIGGFVYLVATMGGSGGPGSGGPGWPDDGAVV